MAERSTLRQLLDLEFTPHSLLIKEHILSSLAWVWKCKDVGVRSQTESALIPLLVVLQESGCSDAHVLTLSQQRELFVEHITVPYLIGCINDSHFTLIWIQCEQLNDLYLQVEVGVLLKSLFGWYAILGDIVQLSDELL